MLEIPTNEVIRRQVFWLIGTSGSCKLQGLYYNMHIKTLLGPQRVLVSVGSC